MWCARAFMSALCSVTNVCREIGRLLAASDYAVGRAAPTSDGSNRDFLYNTLSGRSRQDVSGSVAHDDDT